MDEMKEDLQLSTIHKILKNEPSYRANNQLWKTSEALGKLGAGKPYGANNEPK